MKPLLEARFQNNRLILKPKFCSNARRIAREKRSVLGVREHRSEQFDDEIG